MSKRTRVSMRKLVVPGLDGTALYPAVPSEVGFIEPGQEPSWLRQLIKRGDFARIAERNSREIERLLESQKGK